MKEITYQNTHRESGHHCRNLLIRCMDFRFHGELESNLPQLLGETACAFDSPGAGGGGSKSVIDEESREVVFAALDIAIEKHGISKVIIADHVDCGAYGGSGRFANEQEEERFHIERLHEARKIISEQYPALEIVLVYQDWQTIKTVD